MGKKTNTVIVNFLLVPPKPGLFPGVGSKAGRQGYCIAGRAGKKTGAHLVKTQENSLVGSPPTLPALPSQGQPQVWICTAATMVERTHFKTPRENLFFWM